MSTQTLYDWKGSNPVLWIIAFFSYFQDNTHHFSFLVSVGFPCLNPSSSRKGAGWVHFCTLSICQVDMWLYVNPSCSWPDLNSQPLIFDSSNIWNSQILWTLLLHCPRNPSACFCSHVGVSLLVSLLSDLLPVSILLSGFGGRWRASSIPQCSQHDCNVITVMVALITCLGVLMDQVLFRAPSLCLLTSSHQLYKAGTSISSISSILGVTINTENSTDVSRIVVSGETGIQNHFFKKFLFTLWWFGMRGH